MSEARRVAETMIKKHEGCVLHPYQDIAGKWTIGWGCRYLINGDPVTPDTWPISQLEADALLDFYVEKTLDAVTKLVTIPTVTDKQLGALTDFAYNEGIYALGGSTLLRLFNSGFTALAADQFDAWVYAGNRLVDDLKRRRAEEKAIFLEEEPDAVKRGIV